MFNGPNEVWQEHQLYKWKMLFVYAIVELFKQEESFQEFSFVFVSFCGLMNESEVVLNTDDGK